MCRSLVQKKTFINALKYTARFWLDIFLENNKKSYLN